MGLDPLSVIAPARVKVLALPVGRIVSAKFLSYIGRLQQESIVRLGDVSPDGRPHRSISLPIFIPIGRIASANSLSQQHSFRL